MSFKKFGYLLKFVQLQSLLVPSKCLFWIRLCDDPGTTDDRGSREGYLRSREVTIRFSPITRDGMEVDMRKCVKRLSSSIWFG